MKNISDFDQMEQLAKIKTYADSLNVAINQYGSMYLQNETYDISNNAR